MEIPPVIRDPLVSVRDAIDRHRHRRRRENVVARIRRVNPESLLFICLGNICRSPYAERVAKVRLPGGYDITSGGFLKEGRTPPVEALNAASARGIEHGDHRSSRITSDDLREADAVFVFDRFNVSDVKSLGGTRAERLFWLGDFDPEWAGKRAIIDPWGRTQEDFDAKFERIDRCLDSVADALTSGRERP